MTIDWQRSADDMELTALVGGERVGYVSVWTDDETGEVAWWGGGFVKDGVSVELAIFDTCEDAKNAVAAACGAGDQTSVEAKGGGSGAPAAPPRPNPTAHDGSPLNGTIRCAYEVHCPGCETAMLGLGETISRAERELRREGWTTRRRLWTCPDCAA